MTDDLPRGDLYWLSYADRHGCAGVVIVEGFGRDDALWRAASYAPAFGPDGDIAIVGPIDRSLIDPVWWYRPLTVEEARQTGVAVTLPG